MSLNDQLLGELPMVNDPTMKPVPIKWAENIADRTGAEAVVVLSFGDGHVRGTSYGETKAKCKIVGKWMDRLIDDMSNETIPAPDL